MIASISMDRSEIEQATDVENINSNISLKVIHGIGQNSEL